MLRIKKKFILILVLITVSISIFDCYMINVYAQSSQKSFNYTIKKNDTLFFLGQRTNCTPETISSINGGLDPKNLLIGSKIKIAPGPGVIIHPVKKGNTVWKLSRTYKSTVDIISRKNFLRDPNLILAGDFLAIPTTPPKKGDVPAVPTTPPKKGTDITPPQVKDAYTTPKSLNVGDTLTFRLNITDDKSGVASATIAFQNPSASRYGWVPLEYDGNLRLWTGTYTVKSTDEGGTYTTFYINANDKAGNTLSSFDVLKPFNDKLTFSINNTLGDITPPQVRSAEATPKNLNVGDTLTFKLDITDDKSGVASATIAFQNPSASRYGWVPLEYDGNLRLWTGTYTVKSTDEGGTYTTFYINANDKAGNTLSSFDVLKPFNDKLTFSINNTLGDITPPQVRSAEATPKNLNVGDTLTFKLDITDDKSGVASATIAFQNPSASRYGWVPLEYDGNLKLWTGTYTVKSTDEGGTYTTFYINANDKAGNTLSSFDVLKPFVGTLTFKVTKKRH